MAKKKLYTVGGIVYSTDPEFMNDTPERKKETLPPSEQELHLKLDRKNRGGKLVTIIEGFKGDSEDMEMLGRKLKSLCAAGGSAEGGVVIIQGDHRHKIFQWLVKNGYNKTRKL
jgi:translation initiation factor 1